jgi:drug/metabolite transporter (DMT)-like permease
MSPQAQGHLAMLLFAALVGGSFSLGALAANEIAPLAFNAVRFWIAAVILGAVVVWRGGVGGAMNAPWRYVVLGVLYAIYFWLMLEGLRTAAPVSASAVFTLTPLMAAVFGLVLLRQRFTARIATALGIGAVGALWVIFDADPAALMAFDIGRGEAVFFIGCVAHALYAPMVRLLNRGEPALVFTLGVLVVGAVALTALGWRDIGATDWGALPGVVWAALLYMAVFTTAVTFVLLQVAALRLPSSKVMAYTYLMPGSVILWELGLGGELPEAVILIGVALTVAALVMLLRDEEAGLVPGAAVGAGVSHPRIPMECLTLGEGEGKKDISEG